MALVKRARRYYLLKRIAALQDEGVGQASVWKGKQEAESGTALPSTFPYLTELAAAGYSTVEDIDGADADELYANAGLNARQSALVIDALAALL